MRTNLKARPEAPQLDLRAILDRWSDFAKDAPRCSCGGCARRRVESFCCAFCGYTGTPWVWACTCQQDGARHAELQRRDLVRLRQRDPNEIMYVGRDGQPVTVAQEITRGEDMLAHYEAKARAPRHRAGDERCDSCHGHRECPVCNRPEGFANDHVAQHAFAIIRDLRAALEARGIH